MTPNNNGNISNWLVVSDIDGTLNNKFRRLPARNKKAIDRFVNVHGGHFTLASGRNVASMEKHYRSLPIRNTPAIVLNGAGIYDFSLNKMLRFRSISAAGKEVVVRILREFPSLEAEFCTQDNILLLNALVFGPALVRADKLPHKKCKTIEEVLPYEWGKVVLFGPPPLIKKVKHFTRTLNSDIIHTMSSSVVTFEILAAGTHKGEAVRTLAEMLGIRYEHTAAIGDYFNDYDMLRSVFLPAACGQAPLAMHKIAKFHAGHCNTGAVADLIEYIEKKYL